MNIKENNDVIIKKIKRNIDEKIESVYSKINR